MFSNTLHAFLLNLFVLQIRRYYSKHRCCAVKKAILRPPRY